MAGAEDTAWSDVQEAGDPCLAALCTRGDSVSSRIVAPRRSRAAGFKWPFIAGTAALALVVPALCWRQGWLGPRATRQAEGGPQKTEELATRLGLNDLVPAPPRLVRVACVGDSITTGLSASSPQMSYPSQLQQLLGPGYQVANYGMNGATLTRVKGFNTSYWDSLQFRQSLSSNPDIVVIMLGMNDAATAVWCRKSKEFVPVYDQLIRVYSSLPTNPKVYIAEPPPIYSGSNYASFFLPGVVNELFPRLLPEIACAPVVRVQSHFQERCPLKSNGAGGAPALPAVGAGCSYVVDDGIHPNDSGYAVIARVMMEALLSLQPAPPAPQRVRCSATAESMARLSGDGGSACTGSPIPVPVAVPVARSAAPAAAAR